MKLLLKLFLLGSLLGSAHAEKTVEAVLFNDTLNSCFFNSNVTSLGTYVPAFDQRVMYFNQGVKSYDVHYSAEGKNNFMVCHVQMNGESDLSVRVTKVYGTVPYTCILGGKTKIGNPIILIHAT